MDDLKEKLRKHVEHTEWVKEKAYTFRYASGAMLVVAVIFLVINIFTDHPTLEEIGFIAWYASIFGVLIFMALTFMYWRAVNKLNKIRQALGIADK